jgi:hypothetical protein
MGHGRQNRIHTTTLFSHTITAVHHDYVDCLCISTDQPVPSGFNSQTHWTADHINHGRDLSTHIEIL